MLEENRFENLLKSLRVRKGKVWTQARTAKLLGVSLRVYVGWENGESLPSHRDLKNITATFELNDADTEILFRAAGQTAPKIQNLPFPPNPLFTGRKALLRALDQLFKKKSSVAITQPISISGLGGIGKTQLALEYAHRCYPNVYRCVLWVNAADRATLEADYLSLARLLELPEKDEREVDCVVQAVKTWLEEHTGWLLILDNADDLQLARSFLPTKPCGHILLTTRSQIVGNIAARIEVEAMEPGEGLLFLLRRSGVLKGEAEPDNLASDTHSAARQLVEILGGHPLALDQAGAYIEETGTSFAEYTQLYSHQRLTLLNERGSLGDQHSETVVVTFDISFQRACELYPPTADVLHFCSFLHPDDIPEELFCQDSGLNLNGTMLNNAIRALRRYSLIKRNTEKKGLSIHRLIQAVLIDAMSIRTRKQWRERVVQAVNEAFPKVEFKKWTSCGRLLPHVQVCATGREHEPISTLATAHLLNKAGTYLAVRAQHSEAEPLLVKALTIREQHLGAEHPDTARSLNNLANLYLEQGKYEQAEPLYQRVLSIREQNLGAEHPDTARSLNNLANVYRDQGKYEQAEPLYQRALSICELHQGTNHPDTALILENLAVLYSRQGKYEQAEPLYQRALSIRKQNLGAEHPDTVLTLNNLANVYRDQGKYEQAEPLYQRALSTFEQLLGTEHPDTAYSLHGLARLYQHQGNYRQAEVLYQRALTILEQCLGPTHPRTQGIRKDYAAFLRLVGRDAEAKLLDTAHESSSEEDH
jgi:tetratricopeptide (TPR) repeat protein